jgi:hypothetical protein
VPTEGAGAPQDGASGLAAGEAADAAGGRGTGAAQEQPGDGRGVTAEREGRPQRPELVERHVDVHGMGAGPAQLRRHRLRAAHRDVEHAVPEPWRAPLHLLEEVVGQRRLAAAPATGERVRRGRRREVDGVLAGRGEAVVQRRRRERIGARRARKPTRLGRPERL